MRRLILRKKANLDLYIDEAKRKFINTHSYEMKELIKSLTCRDAKFYERTTKDIADKQLLQELTNYVQQSDDYANILYDILQGHYKEEIIDTIIEDAYLSINLSEQWPLIFSLINEIKNE